MFGNDDDDYAELMKRAKEHSKLTAWRKANNIKTINAVFFEDLFDKDIKLHKIYIVPESEEKRVDYPYEAWYKTNKELTEGTAYFLTPDDRTYVNNHQKQQSVLSVLKKTGQEQPEYFSKIPDNVKFVLCFHPDSYNELRILINSKCYSDSDSDSDSDNVRDSDSDKICWLTKKNLQNLTKIDKIKRMNKWLMVGGKSRQIKSRRVKSRRTKSRSRQTRRH